MIHIIYIYIYINLYIYQLLKRSERQKIKIYKKQTNSQSRQCMYRITIQSDRGVNRVSRQWYKLNKTKKNKWDEFFFFFN